MKKLAKLVEELEKDLSICVRCGTCQAVCPLYNVTLKEGDVARGKLALLDGLVKDLFSEPDKVKLAINKCLLCGSCAASCPSNVDTVKIFLKSRMILTEYSKLSLIKKIIFRGLISQPERFDKLISFVEKFQFIVFKDNKTIQQTLSFRFIPSFFLTRKFLKIAKTPFHKTNHAISFNNGNKDSRYKVAFFPGCVIDKIFPNIAIDTIEILKYHKVDVFTPQNLGCCGIPALTSGDKDTFRNLLDHNIDILSSDEFDYLITPCATCLSTIKNLWPNILNDENKENRDFLDNLSSKSMDISQFLINILDVSDIITNNSAENITYHDPCHHSKMLNIKNEPRKLIKASGNKLIEMDKPDSCCGMGGTFNLSHYDESVKIGKLKGKNIIKTNCQIVATSCPACMMQLSDILDKQDTNIAVKHPVEIYKQALIK